MTVKDHQQERFPFLSSHGEGVLLQLQVAPRASIARIVGIHGDHLKVAVQAAPTEGRANEAVVAPSVKAARVSEAINRDSLWPHLKT